jgi:hypothetical protein
METSNIIKAFEDLSLVIKVLILFFGGWLRCGLYRIFKYMETKNTTTLVIGILNFFGLAIVLVIADIITEITSGKITFLAD